MDLAQSEDIRVRHDERDAGGGFVHVDLVLGGSVFHGSHENWNSDGLFLSRLDDKPRTGSRTDPRSLLSDTGMRDYMAERMPSPGFAHRNVSGLRPYESGWQDAYVGNA